MKVLWIVNSLFGPCCQELLGNTGNGLWMQALLDDFEKNNEIQVIVATTWTLKNTMVRESNGTKYYVLPSTYPANYNIKNKKNIEAWKTLLQKEKPDLIQAWGTEFSHTLLALKLAKQMDIPSVIYMQGYLRSIAKHYFAGIDYNDIKKNITFRDRIKKDSIIDQQKQFEKNSIKEKEMFELSNNVIIENDWCEKNIQAIVPNINAFRCPLSINSAFTKYSWKLENAEKHSLICTASGYTIKGLHMVLNAMALLKDIYKDIKLYVPGEKQVVLDGGLKAKLKINGYKKYITKLIDKYKLEDNVIWLGQLTQEDLAKEYSTKRVFVMPSSIENHSSSLKEAMIVGTPCVSSRVGGIAEYLTHGRDGFLYRFNEYELLATYIAKLFEDDVLCNNFSSSAKEKISQLHFGIDMYASTKEVYAKILSNKGN